MRSVCHLEYIFDYDVEEDKTSRTFQYFYNTRIGQNNLTQ